MSHWTTLEEPDLRGRRAIVTGANSGLGYRSALALALYGAEVVLAVRDLDRGRQAVEKILAAVPQARLRSEKLDLADLSSVRRFADQESARGPIHILLNNAGVMLVPRRESTLDGFELHMGINHLGHFALTGALLPALAPAARVVSVSSIAHRTIRRINDDLQPGEPYTPMRAYAQSKLAVLIFGLEFDRRLRQAGSTVRSVVAHPGWSATAEQRPGDHPGFAVAFSRRATALLGSRPAEGARPQVHAAVGPLVRGGDFLGPRALIRGGPHVAAPSRVVRDERRASRLWEVSERLTGVEFRP